MYHFRKVQYYEIVHIVTFSIKTTKLTFFITDLGVYKYNYVLHNIQYNTTYLLISLNETVGAIPYYEKVAAMNTSRYTGKIIMKMKWRPNQRV